MNLRWRFSCGILFSLTIHTLLIDAFVYTYPAITNRDEWSWKEFSLFSYELPRPSALRTKNNEKNQDIISKDKMIYPDLVIIKKQKSYQLKTIKKSILKPPYTLSKILTQIEKFPERVNEKLISNKQLSAPVVSLLSLLPQKIFQKNVQVSSSFFGANEKNTISSFNSNELKIYLKKLSKFISEGWEVPIHLKESQVKVAIMFEINKNGKLLNWELEESGSPALQNSVNNLMRNLKFLPALPESYQENSYIFGVRFSPTIPHK